MRTCWCTLVFLGLMQGAFIPAAAPYHENDQAADMAAIQQVCANLDAAWNRRDAVALSDLFLNDADFQWHTGELLKGRKQIEQYFGTSVFQQMPVDYRHITTIKRLRFLEPDIAIGDGTIVVSRDGAAENEKPYLHVLFASVGQKKKGLWRIAAVRLMIIKSD